MELSRYLTIGSVTTLIKSGNTIRAQIILNTFLNDVTSTMHKVRRASPRAVLSSVLSGSQLSITAIGRNIDSKTSEKHQIKRSMRLVSNTHLYHEIRAIYSALAMRVVGQQTHPVILATGLI